MSVTTHKCALAVITYRRLHALKTMLEGLAKHCGQYPLAIFEDLGNRDGTEDFLAPLGMERKDRPDLLAQQVPLECCTQANWTAFLGTRNLGVSGNSNRAIKWFMEETDADQLCLCNDDLFVLGDFPAFYGQAHQDLEVGMFSFCDFTHHESYRWATVRLRGYGVKLCPRFVGIMVSLTRPLLEKVGYFDMRFGKFGEEHCDFTIRCRFAGGIRLEGKDQHQLDLEHALLKHQEVETSVTGPERQRCDQEAGVIMHTMSRNYMTTDFYRPFGLVQLPMTAGAYRKAGIPVDQLKALGYKIVEDTEPARL